MKLLCFYHLFFPLLKKFLLWLCIVKKKELGAVPKQCGICSKPILLQKSFLYIVFGTLVAYTYPCMCAHAISMHMYGLSVHTHTRVCVCTLRVSYGLSFPKIVYFLQKQVIFSIKTFFKSIFIWLGPKPNLGLKVLTSSENGSPSRKGYKMRHLQSFPQIAPNWWCIWSSVELFV